MGAQRKFDSRACACYMFFGSVRDDIQYIACQLYAC